MFIPLGAEGERRLIPWVTLGIIVLNLLVHLFTIPWVDGADRREQEAASELYRIEMEISMERGISGFDAEALFHPRPTERHMFWDRWQRGEILPKSDPDFIRHEKAVADLRRAIDAHPYQRFGFRGTRPTLASIILAAFLHGGWMHVIGNMVLLWALGATLEESWGRRLFVLAYLVGIFVAPWGCLFGADRGAIPGIGASGAVATIAGAFAVRHFTKKLRFFSFVPIPGIYSVHGGWYLLFWFAQQVYAHGTDAGLGGVGFGVHAFGFLAGAGLALAFRAGGSEAVAEPEQAALVRRAERDAQLEKANELLAQSDMAGALQAVTTAVAATPEDPDLHEKLYEMHAATGDVAGAASDARTALRLWWLQGRRDRYVSLFQQAERKLQVTFPADATHKAAVVLELQDPAEASRLHARVIERSPADPVAKQSLERLAKLFERLGEPDKAAQVRSLRPKLERQQAPASSRSAPPPS